MTDLLRGHPIRLSAAGEWVFCDTGEPAALTWRERPCGACGRRDTPEGHDACLGMLPGVVNACCGHGDTATAYVVLDDGTRLAGREALAWVTTTQEGTDDD